MIMIEMQDIKFGASALILFGFMPIKDTNLHTVLLLKLQFSDSGDLKTYKTIKISVSNT